ncbi:putative transcriptional regulator [Izhakiella capsodis]|uniref:Putative transcriptional regulator n=1 Tax=Izhakiella capsodis TaxID=1367852 RepID=A0A1I5ATJ1_9GAMM|nr:helix-turn-helix domain-containing protein [Izhakiella capsodis]SFN65767.1 putative transcriptional regulator [Izhakiella capsodis]
METREPIAELLSSLEQIVLSHQHKTLPEAVHVTVMPEPKKIRERSGMEVEQFASALGVSVSSVRRWESHAARPSGSAQKLLQLLHTNPLLYKQLVS